tara:strand:- start:151 stop:723 length:573 start_codon:yes stop_codon:yes gene_type:complete
MSNPIKTDRAVTVLILTMLLSSVFVYCSGTPADQSNKSRTEKISDFERLLTVDDVIAIGWKKGKTYDVEGLEGADSAFMGFWELSGVGLLNYEVRIYPSHADAVDLGIKFAENASGVDAALNVDDALWDEGVRDRRIIVGGGSRGSQNPRYGDYVIVGNMVILCEGRTPEHSLDQCAPFVAKLKSEGMHN